MQLADSDILEFQEMCRKHLGLELSWTECQERAIKLVSLMQAVYRPMSLEEYEALRHRDKTINEYEEDYEQDYEPAKNKP